MFLSGNILLSLIIVFHLKVQCTIFLKKLRYRDIVAFSTKKLNEWEFGRWLTANFTFPAVTWRNIVWSFSMPLWCKCNKHLPGQSASINIAFWFFGMFVSARTPSMFLGKGKLCLFPKQYNFSTFKLFSMVKWLRQSTAFCLKYFVIDSLLLMGRQACRHGRAFGGSAPPNFFWAPPTFIVSRKICFENII